MEIQSKSRLRSPLISNYRDKFSGRPPTTTGMQNNRFTCPCCCQKKDSAIRLHSFARARIQEEKPVVVPLLLKVEHLVDRAGNAIERSLANTLSTQPVVFDETNDRTLVGHGVIHKVPPRPR